MKDFRVLFEIDCFRGSPVNCAIEVAVAGRTPDEARLKARVILRTFCGDSSISAIDHVFDPSPEGL
jgi:hypothetical protein